MKNLFLIIAAGLLTFCSSSKNDRNMAAQIHNECPDGTCDFEIINNTELVIHNDDTGKLYYSLAPKEGKIVIKYTYTKKNDPIYQDSGYSEELLFESDNSFFDREMPEYDKMLIGVKCFCKGKAGYYKVNNSRVEVKNKKLFITVPEDNFDGQIIKNLEITLQ